MRGALSKVWSWICGVVKCDLPNKRSAFTLSYERSLKLFNECDKLIKGEELFLEPNFNIDSLARKIGTNRSYLSVAINRHCNATFSTYLNGIRVSYAKERMLSNPKIGVDEVATLSGFGSSKTFIRHFKEFEGVTPGRYLKAINARQT